MLLAAILTLITGSTDTHVAVVSQKDSKYTSKYVCTMNKFGARANKKTYEQFDLVDFIGEETLQKLHAEDPIEAVYAGNSIGYSLNPSTYKKVTGVEDKYIDQLKGATNKESVEITDKIYSLALAIQQTPNQNVQVAQEFGFVTHLAKQTKKIAKTLEIEQGLPFFVGIKKNGAKFTDGEWANKLVRQKGSNVIDMGGGRGKLYFKEVGKKPKKIALSTNTLFSEDTNEYLGLKEEYINQFATFLEKQEIDYEEQVLVFFTGKARNSKSSVFLKDLQTALQEKGFLKIKLHLLDSNKEGKMEVEVLEEFLNSKHPSKLNNLFEN